MKILMALMLAAVPGVVGAQPAPIPPPPPATTVQGHQQVIHTVRCTVDAAGKRYCTEQSGVAPKGGPLEVLDQFSTLMRKGDIRTAADLLADDATIYEGGEAESKVEYLAGHADADAKFLAGTTQSNRRRQARVLNGMASINTVDRLSKDGKSYDTAETAVLMETPQGWKILSLHWSSRKLDTTKQN